MRVPPIALALLAAPFLAMPLGRALEPLTVPAPLSPAPAAVTPGVSAIAFASAERAQALGFPSTAVTLLRSMLVWPGADQARLTLALSTALLDEGDLDGAAAALASLASPRGSPWNLRQGLIAAERQQWESARADLAGVRLGDLGRADVGWYYFLKGVLAQAGKDGAKDPQPGRAEGFSGRRWGRRVPRCSARASCSRRSRPLCGSGRRRGSSWTSTVRMRRSAGRSAIVLGGRTPWP